MVFHFKMLKGFHFVTKKYLYCGCDASSIIIALYYCVVYVSLCNNFMSYIVTVPYISIVLSCVDYCLCGVVLGVELGPCYNNKSSLTSSLFCSHSFK